MPHLQLTCYTTFTTLTRNFYYNCSSADHLFYNGAIMQISNYTSPEEQEYIRYRHIQQPLPYFAPGELEKVENFEIARSEGFYG